MKIKNSISVSKSGFVFDSKTGESYSLNSTAREIIELLLEGRGEEEVKEYFATKYNVEDGVFARHLDDYFQMLTHFHLVDSEQ